MKKGDCTEVLLWSIALPGFGQILNGKFLKGLSLIGLEFLINVQSHLNDVIILSFKGDIEKAINQTNYQWLMFYPCIYMFGIWDAYKDAGGGELSYSTLPFVLGAYLGTIGVIYSPTLKILGILFGGVWLGIMGLAAGVCLGQFLRFVLRRESIR